MHSTARDPMDILLRSSRPSRFACFPLMCALLLATLVASLYVRCGWGTDGAAVAQSDLTVLAAFVGLSMALYHSRHGRMLEALRNSGFTETLLLTGRSPFWVCDGLVRHSLRSLLRWAVPFYAFDIGMAVLLDRHGALLALNWLPGVVVATVGACYVQLMYAGFQDRRIARGLAGTIVVVAMLNTALVVGILDAMEPGPATVMLCALSALVFAFERMLVGFEVSELERARPHQESAMVPLRFSGWSPILQREQRRRVRRNRLSGPLLAMVRVLMLVFPVGLALWVESRIAGGATFAGAEFAGLRQPVSEHAVMLFVVFLVLGALTAVDAVGAMVRERQQRTFELLAASPLRAWEYFSHSIYGLVRVRLLCLVSMLLVIFVGPPGPDPWRLLYCLMVGASGVLLMLLSACIGVSVGLTVRGRSAAPTALLWSLVASALVWNPLLQTQVERLWVLFWPLCVGLAAVCIARDLLLARLQDSNGCLQWAG